MRYTLLWTPQLAVFSMSYPNCDHKIFTEQELRDKLQGDATLLAWVDFAKQHPNVSVDYEMLPM